MSSNRHISNSYNDQIPCTENHFKFLILPDTELVCFRVACTLCSCSTTQLILRNRPWAYVLKHRCLFQECNILFAGTSIQQRCGSLWIIPSLWPFQILHGHLFVALLFAKPKQPFLVIYSVWQSRLSLFMSLFLLTVMWFKLSHNIHPRSDSQNLLRSSDWCTYYIFHIVLLILSTQ